MPEMIQTEQAQTTPGEVPDSAKFEKLLAALTPSELLQVAQLLDSLLKSAA